MIETKQIIEFAVNNNLPFYIYRKPNESTINLGITIPNMVENGVSPDIFLNKSGFIFTPFDKDNDLYFIKPVISLSFKNETDLNFGEITNDLNKLVSLNLSSKKTSSLFNKSLSQNSDSFFPSIESLNYKTTSREEYDNSFTIFKALLDNNILSKIILSRRIVSQKGSLKDIYHIFSSLLLRYETAFVYIVFIPGKECWCGASPETLLISNKNGFETMSLAGTNHYTPYYMNPNNWDKKDLEEQQFVTSYIRDILANSDIKGWSEEKLTVKKTGTIVHLLTLFKGPNPLNSKDISYLINNLHPTPAVCGIPSVSAENVIKEKEHYNREFYSGYLGPIGNNSEVDLFVNLRCAKILSNGIVIFAGGGLTKDSNSDKEWDETTLKSQTILNALEYGE
ncbi:MAG: chorismate-binding protein [Bacteroidales bacterium]|nr:chorismate-binding protein [Bacteroidales bacterium]